MSLLSSGYVLADDGDFNADSEITGSGSTGQVAVFTSATSIGNPTVAFTSGAAGFTIGLNTTETSALFSLSSTTTGFLPPRMTAVQRDAITTPIAGLMVYNSTANTYSVCTVGGATPTWQNLITTSQLPATYVVGDILYASTTTTMARLADVDVGSVLISGGVGVAPSWSSSPSVTTSLTTPILYSPSIISSTAPTTGISIVSTTTGTTYIDSGTTGDVNIGTNANAKTITIGNSTSATAISLITGTGGLSINTNNGNFSLTSGTGSVNIGTDTVAHTVTVGSVTGTSSTSILGGTGGINVGASPVAQTITIGNVTSTTRIVINSGTGQNTWTTTNGSWTLATGTGAISIGTDAADHAITIGNSTGTTPISLDAGTSGVNIGTNAIAHTVTIGNVTGATAVNINCGTGTSTWTTTNGVWTLATGTGTVNISTDNTVNAINIGTGGAAKTIKFGSISGTLISFFGVTAIAQVTTGIAAATFVANTSGIANDTATWDGYTFGQVVKGMRNYGLLT